MKTFINTIIIISVLCGMVVFAQNDDTLQKVLVIDAGHGGIDSGGIAKNGILEKDVVLDIAIAMEHWNKELLDSKYNIYLTRSSDTLISLSDRTKMAKHIKPDIFISLHCNHAPNKKANGVEVYTYGNENISLEHGHHILTQLSSKLGFKMREPKRGNFQVLREAHGKYPALLLELGYLSNMDESGYLIDRKNRKILALAILMAIKI
ncbi:N-acetylmuramoyl-L-alanine amidase [uncultured Croceitalea sp.]|uniref:N-acetylmuramoyl-L-alanine amidase family protein n=1 Tax=uncultured Croceitalea sp. TaxID=1798908 RepID=UPI003305BA27